MVGETPNIDRIANEGAKFMAYYAMQSCTAGRNAFFTGMYPLRTGMIPPQLPGSPPICGPAPRRSASSCTISVTTPASSAKTTWAIATAALPTAHGFHEFWGYLYHLDAMQQVSFRYTSVNEGGLAQLEAVHVSNFYWKQERAKHSEMGIALNRLV